MCGSQCACQGVGEGCGKKNVKSSAVNISHWGGLGLEEVLTYRSNTLLSKMEPTRAKRRGFECSDLSPLTGADAQIGILYIVSITALELVKVVDMAEAKL